MSDVKIRIDTKNYRINIHRQALSAIGDPPFLNFGYEPESTQLMVIGTWIDDRKSVRVRHDRSGSVYVYSKALLFGIKEVSGILTEAGSYIAEGDVMKSGREILFTLRNARFISEDCLKLSMP